jgi:hypothetical protein
MHLKFKEILAFSSLKVYYCSFQVTFQDAVPIDILYTLDSASNYSAIQKLKP